TVSVVANHYISFLFTLGGAFATTRPDTMTVRFPSESKIEISMANNTHAQISIVDDDALSRKVLAQVLTSAGYSSAVCGDGAAVLRARIETQLRLRCMRRQLERQNDELERWRRDLERDLAAARLTQQSLIPQKPLVLPGWVVAASYRPVIQVGGDIYGWLCMKDGRILFWIADGSGHGAAAALLTTLAKLLFHHGSAEHNAPASVMEAVNDDFRSRSEEHTSEL